MIFKKMYIQQIYTNCLAQASYYIESEGVAAIIDPLRDTEVYMQMAQERHAKIKYIIETHFHADFVSGHVDLANKTGAEIIYGPGATTGFDIRVTTDHELLPLGACNIEVLHTPGHTPESTCFLLKDADGKDHALFTGDTLFIGDVGRPDLLDGLMTKEALAGMMYDSLRNQIMPLSDDVMVYPGHGAGSACGKNIGKETFDTLGHQKEINYALQPMSREDFIKAITEGIAPAPAYFFEDAKINKYGAPALDAILKSGLTPLEVASFETQKKEGAIILDTRKAADFEMGFVPGSYNVGLDGQYAIWAATIASLHHPVILITPQGQEEEAVTRLARVGFDQIQGYLEGSFDAWIAAGKRYDMVISITPEEFALDVKHSKNATVIDVRREGEYQGGHVKGASNIALAELPEKLKSLDPEKEYLIYCAGGYRSMIASSLMKSGGFQKVKNVYGGFAQIKDSGVEVEK